MNRWFGYLALFALCPGLAAAQDSTAAARIAPASVATDTVPTPAVTLSLQEALDQAGLGNVGSVRCAVVEISSGLDMWLSATPVGSNGFCQVIDVVTAGVRHGVHVDPLIRRCIGAFSALDNVLQQPLYRLRASLGQRVDPCLCHPPVALDLGKIVSR